MVKLLKKCDYATLLVCTMGPGFEKKIDEIKETEPAEAFYLDRIGAWMADYFADPVERLIETEINKNGYQKTFRFGVGYGDWKLPVQEEVLKITEAYKIGVTHNEAYIMDPRFSVSALIGWERKAGQQVKLETHV
jgi:cobalamin-dependent methionine synthase I